MNHRHPAPNVGAATREPLLTPKEAAAWLRVSLSFLAKARMRGDGTPVLIEPSFADAIRMIVASDELPEQTRRHWATSLRQIAKALDKPLELIPARYSAIGKELAHLHEVPAGLTAKTLRNHKSNVKSALLWLTREKDVGVGGMRHQPPFRVHGDSP